MCFSETCLKTAIFVILLNAASHAEITLELWIMQMRQQVSFETNLKWDKGSYVEKKIA